MTPSKISPSNLGAMAAPKFCPKCFWRLLHLRFRKPFDFPMPGIMFFLDAHQKQLAQVLLRKNGKLPKFFGRFTNAESILPIEWVEFFDDETGILVRGKPDLLLKLPDGKIVVVDNKTAIHHGDDDLMFPRYRTQTNAYGAALMFGDPPRKVGALALLHFEFRALTDDEIVDNVDDTFVWTRFRPRMVDVELNPDQHVRPYLQTLRTFLDMEEVPDGREGCRDCALLDDFATLIAEGRITDALIYSDERLERNQLIWRLQYNRVLGADAYISRSPEKTLPVIPQEPDGLFALWDFSAD